jgi:hypothetical protein
MISKYELLMLIKWVQYYYIAPFALYEFKSWS